MQRHSGKKLGDCAPPSRSWAFAQLLLGEPLPDLAARRAEARRRYEQLEWLASISERHERELRAIQRQQAETRHQRETLEWLASISERHEEQLRKLVGKEAEMRAIETFIERLANGLPVEVADGPSVQEAKWDSSKHPRVAKGNPDGGEFTSKGGEGTAATAPGVQKLGSDSKKGSRNPGEGPLGQKQPIVTKTQLPADERGSWISGTRGDGVFRFNDSPKNREAGLVGKEVRFENQHIAVGGFPPEFYYSGNSEHARVEIQSVTGFEADSVAADEAMRTKLGDPHWQRPKGYIWNHAGPPGSKSMELVDKEMHKRVSHKGWAAELRAIRRAARIQGRTARAMGALTVYLTARDALQAAGVLQPDYEVAERETYHFVDGNGSVFTVRPAGLFTSAKREFVAGPRKGQIETITSAQVDEYRRQAEQEWGKYVPGSLFSEPRFIPGSKRTSLPLIQYRNGIPYEVGWIDEKGVHRYPNPRPQPA